MSVSRVRLADLDPDQPIGSIVGVDLDGTGRAAVHTVGGWVLVPDRCPHAQCAFIDDGELADDGTLICNCHGSEFDPLTGELLLGPAVSGLAVLPLEVVDGAVVVRASGPGRS